MRRQQIDFPGRAERRAVIATQGTGPKRGPHRGPGARLIDVAQAAGVSAQTASNVLGGRSGFTEATRQRVLAAADELNYKPNRAAQRLRSHRSHQLGLHLPAKWLSVQEPFAISFLRSSVEAAESVEQQLVMFTSPLEERSVEALVRSGVDGFLLCNVADDDPRPRVFSDLGVPFMIMGRLDPTLPQNCVDIDNAAAMAQVVDYLVARGHRRFAYVGYPIPFYAEVERAAGTHTRLHDHGLDLPDKWVVTTSLEAVEEQVTRRLLDGDMPDAVICSSDTLAVRVHRGMLKRGLRPGTDIALTGFDALPLPVEVEPALTSVRLPIEDITAAMIDHLLKQIDGHHSPITGRLVPTQLALGQTA